MPERTLKRIMYVDDEAELVGQFTLCLCSSGKEALEEAKTFNPDLVLLDVMMPEMDGPTTLAALRRIEALASTPVIFVTAKAQPSEVRHYRALGAIEVITKPFHPMKLPDQLRQLWRGCDQVTAG